ncbi:hypothetical protein DsansV1_C06g0066121 [Dioscorea sansibarensis]
MAGGEELEDVLEDILEDLVGEWWGSVGGGAGGDGASGWSAPALIFSFFFGVFGHGLAVLFPEKVGFLWRSAGNHVFFSPKALVFQDFEDK